MENTEKIRRIELLIKYKEHCINRIMLIQSSENIAFKQDYLKSDLFSIGFTEYINTDNELKNICINFRNATVDFYQKQLTKTIAEIETYIK